MKTITLIIATLLISNVVNAEQKQTLKVDARNMTINGVNLGSGEKEIIKALGKPIKTIVGFSEAITKKTKDLHFKGLHIYLSEDSILNLKCHKKCITNKGIKIGSTIKQVFEAYGTNQEQKDQASYVFWVPEGYIDAHLIFHFKNGVVNKIEYWVNYV